MNESSIVEIRKQAFFELVKIGLGTSDGKFDFTSLSDEDWSAVMKESGAQAMGLICFDAAAKTTGSIPREVHDLWFKKAIRVTTWGVAAAQGRKALSKLLSENGIKFVILKGASSAYYYPAPDKRNAGDVDFYVESSDLERARELLSDNGYIMEPDHSDVHYTFIKNRLPFELHKTFPGLPEGREKEVFLAELSDIIDKAEYVAEDLSKPSDFHHGIIIFLHTLHHMLSCGLGIRQFCDWACFVKKTHRMAFWKERFVPLLKKTGTLMFASAFTEACVRYLNIERPDWCLSVTEDQYESLVNELYRSGNFGRKIENNTMANSMFAKDGKKLTVWGKIIQLFRSLNSTNKIVFPILNKAPYLYPFIMIYRILRYIVLVIRGERRSLSELSKKATEKNDLFLKFELYKTK